MTARVAVRDESHIRSECWCCGRVEDRDRMVHLGIHPEVAVCVRCAHTISKWAWEIEDRARTGLAVRARDRSRAIRTSVVARGWHRNRFTGPALRWLGKYLP
jgi:hypothetical protein